MMDTQEPPCVDASRPPADGQIHMGNTLVQCPATVTPAVVLTGLRQWCMNPGHNGWLLFSEAAVVKLVRHRDVCWGYGKA